MSRILVISDIHGELAKFEALLAAAQYNSEQDQLILLGDYVDRGPDAKGVIDRVMALKEAGARVLKGNHEDLMIKALTTSDERAWKRWAQINGGDMTLQSYGLRKLIMPSMRTRSRSLSQNCSRIWCKSYYWHRWWRRLWWTIELSRTTKSSGVQRKVRDNRYVFNRIWNCRARVES